MPKRTIPEDWDPGGDISPESDATVEFEMWKAHAERNPEDWQGDEFSLQDFERYIRLLKARRKSSGPG